MVHHIIGILLDGLVVFITSRIVPGFVVRGYGPAVGVAIVYGVLSWLLKSVLVFATQPIIFLTFGLFLLVINAFLLWLTDKLMGSFEIKSKSALAAATVLITIGQSAVSMLMR